MLSAVEIAPREPARSSVIWLHGLGADGHDFEPVVEQLALPRHLATRFVLPHAPTRPITINGGYVMRAWYDVVDPDLTRDPDEAGLRESSDQLAALIQREVERGIAPHAIVVAGFSQGGAIALYTGLRHPTRLAGVLALSSYLPLVAAFEKERHPANAHTPVLMAHGSDDPLILLSVAERSRDQLRHLNYDVEWHSYAMQHSVCAAELSDVAHWLQKVLAR